MSYNFFPHTITILILISLSFSHATESPQDQKNLKLCIEYGVGIEYKVIEKTTQAKSVFKVDLEYDTPFFVLCDSNDSETNQSKTKFANLKNIVLEAATTDKTIHIKKEFGQQKLTKGTCAMIQRDAQNNYSLVSFSSLSPEEIISQPLKPYHDTHIHLDSSQVTLHNSDSKPLANTKNQTPAHIKNISKKVNGLHSNRLIYVDKTESLALSAMVLTVKNNKQSPDMPLSGILIELNWQESDLNTPAAEENAAPRKKWFENHRFFIMTLTTFSLLAILYGGFIYTQCQN